MAERLTLSVQKKLEALPPENCTCTSRQKAHVEGWILASSPFHRPRSPLALRSSGNPAFARSRSNRGGKAKKPSEHTPAPIRRGPESPRDQVDQVHRGNVASAAPSRRLCRRYDRTAGRNPAVNMHSKARHLTEQYKTYRKFARSPSIGPRR
jgi:hypothetical protein